MPGSSADAAFAPLLHRRTFMVGTLAVAVSGCSGAPSDGQAQGPAATGAAAASPPPAMQPAAQAIDPGFETWLRGARQEAVSRGIRAATFDRATAGLQPIPRVLELDRAQPEFKLTYAQYMDRVVSEARVTRGRALLQEHRALLEAVAADYRVPPTLIVALWGVESDFGRIQGNFNVIGALATLAYHGRRQKFFRGELMNALRILDEGHIAVDAMKGSWAGAMGQSQFMPSSFLRFAVDRDGDGRRDIWQTPADVFASIANYMNGVGWKHGQGWGRQVRLPAGLDVRQGGKRSLRQWAAAGVRAADGGPLPASDMQAQLVRGGEDGPPFLTYDNFRAILAWNRSNLFALAVGQLMDRLGN